MKFMRTSGEPFNINLAGCIEKIQAEYTIQTLQEIPFEHFSEGYCLLRSTEGEIAKVTVEDAFDYQWNLRDVDSDEILHSFSSVQEIIKFGWFLD